MKLKKIPALVLSIAILTSLLPTAIASGYVALTEPTYDEYYDEITGDRILSGVLENGVFWEINTTEKYMYIDTYDENGVEIPDFAGTAAQPWVETENVEELSIGWNITAVGSYAFSDFENLRWVDLTGLSKTIRANAFNNSNNIEDVAFFGETMDFAAEAEGNSAFINANQILIDKEIISFWEIDDEGDMLVNDRTTVAVGETIDYRMDIIPDVEGNETILWYVTEVNDMLSPTTAAATLTVGADPHYASLTVNSIPLKGKLYIFSYYTNEVGEPVYGKSCEYTVLPGNEGSEEIVSVLPIADIQVKYNEEPETGLPDTVTAVLENGVKAEVAVSWELSQTADNVYTYVGTLIIDEAVDVVNPDNVRAMAYVTVADAHPITAQNTSTAQQISCDVTLSGSVYSGVVLAALYNGNRLVSLKSYTPQSSIPVSFDSGLTGTYVKLMWWDSIETMQPMCIFETVALQAY